MMMIIKEIWPMVMIYLLRWLVVVHRQETYIPPKGKSGTGTSRKVNSSKSTPSTIQVDDSTYYLYKGESIEVDGHQYFCTFD
jgi:hypothetical protein